MTLYCIMEALPADRLNGMALVVQDSTTVDFAYHVHTDVGNQMVGAKVNGKLVNPEHLLQNAEVIEVLTYDGPPTALAVSRHYVSLSNQASSKANI